MDLSTVLIDIEEGNLVGFLRYVDLLLLRQILDHLLERDGLRVEGELLKVALRLELDLDPIRLHLLINYKTIFGSVSLRFQDTNKNYCDV